MPQELPQDPVLETPQVPALETPQAPVAETLPLDPVLDPLPQVSVLDQLLHTLQEIVAAIPLFVIALVIMLFAKFLYDKTCKFSFDDELTDKDNPAFGVALGGYLLGVAIAIAGAFHSAQSYDLIVDAQNLAISGLMAVVLMRLSIFINNKFILNKFDIYKEMIGGAHRPFLQSRQSPANCRDGSKSQCP